MKRALPLVLLGGCAWIGPEAHQQDEAVWLLAVADVTADCASGTYAVQGFASTVPDGVEVTATLSTGDAEQTLVGEVQGGSLQLAFTGLPVYSGGPIELQLTGVRAQRTATLAVEVDGGSAYVVDADGDGTGSGALIDACAPPPGTTTVQGDCDDTDPDVSPQATEICNGRDDDCDGLVDEADPSLATELRSYIDGDGDGFPGTAVPSCSAGTSFDCDDDEPLDNPGAEERCDGRDNDCDGLIDDADPSVVDPPLWYLDHDGDGEGTSLDAVAACAMPPGRVASGEDCNDEDATVTQVSEWYRDLDMDGAAGSTAIIVQCDRPPGGALAPTDCDDEDRFRYPGAPERCDGLDSDCVLPDGEDALVVSVGTEDYETLQEALDAAGSTATFQVCGPHTWSGTFAPTDWTLQLQPDAQITGRLALTAGQVDVQGGVLVGSASPLDGTLAHLSGGASLTLDAVEARCTPGVEPSAGGALRITDGSTLTVGGSRIHGCQAERGGAIAATGSTVNLGAGTVLDANGADQGGAIWLEHSDLLGPDPFDAGTLPVLSNNSALLSGGAIHVEAVGTVGSTGSTTVARIVVGANTGNSGAGLHAVLQSEDTLVLEDLWVYGNTGAPAVQATGGTVQGTAVVFGLQTDGTPSPNGSNDLQIGATAVTDTLPASFVCTAADCTP